MARKTTTPKKRTSRASSAPKSSTAPGLEPGTTAAIADPGDRCELKGGDCPGAPCVEHPTCEGGVAATASSPEPSAPTVRRSGKPVLGERTPNPRPTGRTSR